VCQYPIFIKLCFALFRSFLLEQGLAFCTQPWILCSHKKPTHTRSLLTQRAYSHTHTRSVSTQGSSHTRSVHTQGAYSHKECSMHKLLRYSVTVLSIAGTQQRATSNRVHLLYWSARSTGLCAYTTTSKVYTQLGLARTV